MVWEIADAIVALGLFDGSAAPAAPVIQQNGVAAFSRLGVGTYRLELSQPQTPTTTLVLCQPAAGNFAVISGAAQANGTILIEARDPRDASLVDVPTFLVEVVRAPQSADPTGALPAPIIPPVGVGSLQTAYNGGNTILQTAADGQVTFSSDAGDPVASLLVLEGANTQDTLRVGAGAGATNTNILLGVASGRPGNSGYMEGEGAAPGSGATGVGVRVIGGDGDGAGGGGLAALAGGNGGLAGGAGGQMIAAAGAGNGGAGGAATLRGGFSFGAANAGAAVVQGGNVSGGGVGNGGNVTLRPGTGLGGGSPGYIRAELSALQFPNLTTVQRDALTGVPTGAQLWNTTTGQLEVWNGAAWVAPGGASTLQGAYDGGQAVAVRAADGPVALSQDAGDPPNTVLQLTANANVGDLTAPGALHITTTAAPYIARVSTGSNGAGNQGTSLQVLLGDGVTTGSGGALTLVGGFGDPDPAGSGDGGDALFLGGGGPGGTGAGGSVTVGGGQGGQTAGSGGAAVLGGGDAPTNGAGGQATVRGGIAAGNNPGGQANLRGGRGGGTSVGGAAFVEGGSGDPAGSGPGGPVACQGGAGSPTGPGGNADLFGGNGGVTSGAGGRAQIGGGDATVGAGGDARVLAGGSSSGNGGEALLRGGQASGVGSGGDAEVLAGSNVGGDGNGGTVRIQSGQGAGSGTGGNVSITAQRGANDQGAGDVTIGVLSSVGTNSNGGNVRLYPGQQSGAGVPGHVGLYQAGIAASPDHSYDRADRHLAARTALGTLGVAVVTTAERDALTAPADTCLLVWNTTTGALEANPGGTGWVAA